MQYFLVYFAMTKILSSLYLDIFKFKQTTHIAIQIGKDLHRRYVLHVDIVLDWTWDILLVLPTCA